MELFAYSIILLTSVLVLFHLRLHRKLNRIVDEIQHSEKKVLQGQDQNIVASLAVKSGVEDLLEEQMKEINRILKNIDSNTRDLNVRTKIVEVRLEERKTILSQNVNSSPQIISHISDIMKKRSTKIPGRRPGRPPSKNVETKLELQEIQQQ